MKTILFTMLIAFGSLSLQAQKQCDTPDLKVGDVLKISGDTNTTFQHINFPKKNFIIKRGGIVDYKKLNNKEVEITGVQHEEGCISKIDVKLADGSKFFNAVSAVSINLKGALSTGEVTLK
ncbi:MAG: hypothetical protein NWQ06_04305 [Leeuwenhoekiella sp.]|uniref:hypothetical protein n=1 Tax=Leeuwenhoekiella sp. MAR_2009_132 TaxID=1392489 RepID=UPI00068BEA38|nr:hypothetical protein [Leeuwenhoekiella sp. MAR_2009_132]MDP5044185.1 hypothetical protein [Leeuwenhoekiella sp.]